MNTSARNVKQSGDDFVWKKSQPHFQTIRLPAKSNLPKSVVQNETSKSDILPKNASLHGAFKFPVARRSNKSSGSGPSRPDISLDSLKSLRTADLSSANSVLSLLKNSSVSGGFFSPMPKNQFRTPLGVSSKHERKKPSKTNKTSSSSGSQFFTTPYKRNSKRTPKSSSSAVSDSSSSMIVAITEGRGLARGEVGIAAVDAKRPHLVLCQISDTQTYANTLRKINILNPAEILVPNTFCDTVNPSKLYEIIREQFPNTHLISVQRKFFSDENGLQQIENICLSEYASVLLILSGKFYALAAAAAILKYAEFEQNIIFSAKSVRVAYETGDNVTFIDFGTAQKLELVINQNIGYACPQNTLFGVLNHCNTAGGQRRLRAVILQPSSNELEISERLDCVQELIQDPELFFSLKKILPKFWDVEQLLSLCTKIQNLKDSLAAAELQINYALLLKTSLETIPPLQNALNTAKTKFFCSFRHSLDNVQYKQMLEKLYETLNDDAHLGQKFDMNLFQRCFCIKTGINAFLDIARLAYTELVQDYNEIVEDLIKEYKLPLTVKILRSKGPILQLTLSGNRDFNVKDLPPIFIQVEKFRTHVTMTTKELLFLKERMNHFIQEIQLLSSVVIYHMLKDLREYIGSLYILCENVAELDLVMSFAQVSKQLTFVRPMFLKDRTSVKASVHPILYKTCLSSPVANDILTSADHNVCIITGPNMGGKSVYIRQVALLQIMAQIGCYVPADSAEFRITDRIFSRIGFNDNMECNSSSFVVELKEMHYIMNSVTPRSVVIIDELCRGTATEEGTAIAWAILEDLLQSTAFIYVTTHFLYLTKLEDLYCNVLNYNFQALEVETGKGGLPHLIYTHRLIRGVVQLEHYGLKLAKSTALPQNILKCSEVIAKKLSTQWKAISVSEGYASDNKIIDDLILKLLEMLDNGILTTDSLNGIIEYTREINLFADEEKEQSLICKYSSDCSFNSDTAQITPSVRFNQSIINSGNNEMMEENADSVCGFQKCQTEETENLNFVSETFTEIQFSQASYISDDASLRLLDNYGNSDLSESSTEELSKSNADSDFFMLKRKETRTITQEVSSATDSPSKSLDSNELSNYSKHQKIQNFGDFETTNNFKNN